MTRFYMICFDIGDERRLIKVSDAAENYGTRVQRSVFECWLDDQGLSRLKNTMKELINAEEDQVRYYSLCPKDREKVLIDGPGELVPDQDYFTP